MSFSKPKLSERLDTQFMSDITKHKFDPDNGWAQVEHAAPSRIREYGAFAHLQFLVMNIESQLYMNKYPCRFSKSAYIEQLTSSMNILGNKLGELADAPTDIMDNMSMSNNLDHGARGFIKKLISEIETPELWK